MTSQVETNTSRSPRKRFGRAWMSRLFGVLLALGCSAIFSTNAYPQQTWDYWGRNVAMTYRVDLSRHDALCNAVVAALNERKISDRPTLHNYPKYLEDHGYPVYSDRRGARFPSLYQNPIFVTWMLHALSQRDGPFFQPVEWIAVPLYNDGKDVVVVRSTFVSTYFAPQSMVAFDDVERFRKHDWGYRGQVLTDEAGLRLLQGPGPIKYDPPHYILPPALPPELRSKPRWKLFNFDGFGEYDLIRFAGKIYVFLREPPEEVALVSEVHRDRTANARCFIGPTKYPFAKH